MVRTKADAASRVAAGGKAPKKTVDRVSKSPSPGGEKLGKDNLPVNRYCPRETPAWQKKITFFIDKNESNTSPPNNHSHTNGKSKRSSSEFDQENDITHVQHLSPPKKSKNNDMDYEPMDMD